jgi:hypothetical protein
MLGTGLKLDPFSIHLVNEDGTEKGDVIGAAGDSVSATMIACTVFSTLQAYRMLTYRKVGVFNGAGQLVAFIGDFQEPDPTATVTPLPA